jgi:hypothetical protein
MGKAKCEKLTHRSEDDAAVIVEKYSVKLRAVLRWP